MLKIVDMIFDTLHDKFDGKFEALLIFI